MKSSKKTITKAEYLQLVGLRTLADRISENMQDLVKAAWEITGELNDSGEPETDYGHCTDFVWGSRSTDELLKLLDLKVEKPAKKGKK